MTRTLSYDPSTVKVGDTVTVIGNRGDDEQGIRHYFDVPMEAEVLHVWTPSDEGVDYYKFDLSPVDPEGRPRVQTVEDRHIQPRRTVKVGDRVILAPGFTNGGSTFSSGVPVSPELQLPAGVPGILTMGEPDGVGDVQVKTQLDNVPFRYAKLDRLIPAPPEGDELPDPGTVTSDSVEAELGRVTGELAAVKAELAEAKRLAEHRSTANATLQTRLSSLGTKAGLEAELGKVPQVADVTVSNGRDLGMDDDGDCVVVVLGGVKLDGGDIVGATRTYRVQLEVMQLVEVEVEVEASDEDEAADEARALVDSTQFTADSDDHAVVVDGYSVYEVEVGRVQEF